MTASSTKAYPIHFAEGLLSLTYGTTPVSFRSILKKTIEGEEVDTTRYIQKARKKRFWNGTRLIAVQEKLHPNDKVFKLTSRQGENSYWLVK